MRPEPDDIARLIDIRDWCREAIVLLGSRDEDECVADHALRLALVRCLEVVGEAGHRLSPAMRTELPTIPWPAMYGMRNRLIHDYGNTDYGLVYRTVRYDFPQVLNDVEGYLTGWDLV